MNRYAGNKVPQYVREAQKPASKGTTLYSSLIPYIVLGVVVGLGAAIAQNPDGFEKQLQQSVELYRAPYIPGVVEGDDIDQTHQRLIDLGIVTVTKVPPGWKPGDLQ